MSSPLAIRRSPPERVQPNTTTADMRWWSYEHGAQWRHPRGASSTLDGLERHPVVQFPWQKRRQDGSDFTSPVDTVPPNAYGVHDRDTAPVPRNVLKGGSHLCSPNYCRRYRPAARFPEPIGTSASHVGFRCMLRAPKP